MKSKFESNEQPGASIAHFKKLVVEALETIQATGNLPSLTEFYGVSGNYYCTTTDSVVEVFILERWYVIQAGDTYALTEYGKRRLAELAANDQAVAA
jgi:hypothetical protein